MSSLQLVRDTVKYVECEAVDDETEEQCTFAGLIDAWTDAETWRWGWDCPLCGRVYDFYVDESDYDDDREVDWCLL